MKFKSIFLFLFVFTSFNPAFSQVKDTIVVGYNINAPFCYEENGKLEGVSFRLWNKLALEDDGNFYKLEEHPLDSLLIGLENSSIDMVISPLTMTSHRIKTIDFSSPYFISNSNGMVKKVSNKNRVLAFISSFFSFNFLRVLGTLFILLTIFGFLVWIFERKKNKEQFGSSIKGLWHGIWWSAVTMTTVGYGDAAPKTVGGRIVGLIWMFSAIILISSITASITSSLTVEKMSDARENVAVFKKLKIGTVKESATEEWLLEHYYSNIKPYHSFQELIDGFKNDEVDLVAYDEPLLRYVLKNNEEDEYELLNIEFNQSMYAMGFSKDFPESSQDAINSKILDIIESNDWKVLLLEYELLNNK